MKKRGAVVSVLCLFLLFLAGSVLADPVLQIKDLNTSANGGTLPPGQFSFTTEFAQLNGTVLFRIDDGVHGVELWKTDGSAAGTVLVKDICPGLCSSGPVGFFRMGERLFFLSNDGVHGYEIWKTDGTTAGTALVADVSPGLRSTLVFDFASVNGLLLFTHNSYPGSMLQLWRSDGTAAGTVPLINEDIFFIGSLGGTLFLQRTDAAHGTELWKTDGTAAGTVLVKDIRPGSASSNPGNAAVIGGRLVFAADDGTAGRELWATDGTEAGTVLLKDIRTGATSSSPEGRTTAGGRVFFAADNGTAGAELWFTDGTEAGTVLVKDVRPGSAGSDIAELTGAGDRVYFHASDGVHGHEMWVSDGSEAGTRQVKDVRPGPNSSLGHIGLPLPSAASGTKLVFFPDDGVHGAEPWVTDGTEAGTQLLADLVPGPDSSFSLEDGPTDGIIAAGGWVYFRPRPTTDVIWRTDGTPAGTVPLVEIDLQTSAFQAVPQIRLPLAGLGGKLLFQATDGITGMEPWTTDGTPAGTLQLADTIPGAYGTINSELAVAGGTAFFTITDESGYDQTLWKTDGTPPGTSLVPSSLGLGLSALTPLGSSLFFLDEFGYGALVKTDGSSIVPVYYPLPEHLTRAGDAVFFITRDEELWTSELWKTDGSSNTLVKQFEGPMAFYRFASAGGLLFFHASDSAAGRELWRSDGTAAGTFLVKDIRPGQASSLTSNHDPVFAGAYISRTNEAAAGNLLFFPADDGVSGSELWRSDGTTAGTWRVKDVFPGPRSSEITQLTAVGSRVFFVADDGVHGRELWVSDGTEAGTRLAADVLPGSGSSLPQELAALGHVLLFSATDGVHGREPWRSNGTAAGTRRTADIAPGALSSSPFSFTAVGPDVYFPANDNTTGFELWAAPRSSLLATFQDVPMTHWAWSFIESVATAGITQGCAAGQYCPALNVNRAEMAVFLERGLRGAGFVPPPATGTLFTDVPASFWAAAWIEQLAADGITSGCAPGQYCPGALVSRAQIAVFLLRAKHGAAYTPPPATGTLFTDVPASYWAAAWIEQLAAEGISTGCAPNLFCPEAPVSREEMAAFLTRTFALPLP